MATYECVVDIVVEVEVVRMTKAFVPSVSPCTDCNFSPIHPTLAHYARDGYFSTLSPSFIVAKTTQYLITLVKSPAFSVSASSFIVCLKPIPQ